MVFEKPVKILTLTTVLVSLLIPLGGCGGGNNTPTAPVGALSGNWQLNLLQIEPRPQTALSLSGFIVDSENALTGSVQVPPLGPGNHCGGVSTLTGTVNGPAVTLSLNTGGTNLSLTGTISSDNQTMFGDYQGPPGSGCYLLATSGTWNAFLVPSLTGSFTGTLANSSYMQNLLGQSTVPPIVVSGTMTQNTNVDASATLTGTINAVGYPCFSTATLKGTISGQNVILSVFSYNGTQIGSIGQVSSPATVVLGSSGVSLNGTNPGQGLGLTAGSCPSVAGDSSDNAQVELTF
jgi:hypothetical protein